jgi:kelch-like protein 2/3
VEQHFSDVVQFDEFLNLTHQQVGSLIKSDRLSVPTEEKVRKTEFKKPPQN